MAAALPDSPLCRWHGETLVLSLHIQPRASRDEIAGRHGDALKVRITAPPVDGRANSHLLRFLAAQFGVARSAIRLVAGTGGRLKRVEIDAPARLPEGLIRALQR